MSAPSIVPGGANGASCRVHRHTPRSASEYPPSARCCDSRPVTIAFAGFQRCQINAFPPVEYPESRLVVACQIWKSGIATPKADIELIKLRLRRALESPSLPGVVQHGRGVIFKEGKRGFLIVPLETTQPDGSILRPAVARCELLSLGR